MQFSINCLIMNIKNQSKRLLKVIFVICFTLPISLMTTSCSEKDNKTFDSDPVFNSEAIFPFQSDHVHGSTIVEMSNGDLLTGWFQGNGERWADDVKIMGARKKKGEKEWSKPFVLADVKEFPDCNPILFLDGKDRLWLMWITIIANQWETSLIKYKVSEDYLKMQGAPIWFWQDDLLIKPGDKAERGIQTDDSFVEAVKQQLDEYGVYLKNTSEQQINSDKWERFTEVTLSKARGENMIREGRLYSKEG